MSSPTIEKPAPERLTENVHMQVELCEIPLFPRSRSREGSFRNRGPARRVESQAKRGQIPRNEAYKEVRRGDLPC